MSIINEDTDRAVKAMEPHVIKTAQNRHLTAVDRPVNWALNRSGYHGQPRLAAIFFLYIFSFLTEQLFLILEDCQI